MARIRTIKPEFWKHEDLSELPAETHMLAAALLNYSDDEGYFKANPKLVKAECCPLRDDSTNVRRMLEQLVSIGYIRLFFGIDGKEYGHVAQFLKHQRVDRPKDSEIKGLEDSTKIRRIIDEPSPPEGKGMEGKGMERKGSRAPAQKSPSDFSSWPQIPSDGILADWLSFRKAKRAPVTQTVIEQMGHELRLAVAHGFTVDQCLSVQQVAGWQGYKFEWHQNREQGNAIGNRNPQSPRLSASDAAWQQYLAESGEQSGDVLDAEYSQVDEAADPYRPQGVQSLGAGVV